MPVMNGVVATQILRSHGITVPIVAVTVRQTERRRNIEGKGRIWDSRMTNHLHVIPLHCSFLG